MIPMEPVDLNSMVTNPHGLKDLDKPDRQQNSTGSKTPAQSPLTGDVQVRVTMRSSILGQVWKKNFNTDNQIFKKSGMPTQNTNSLLCLILSQTKRRTVKISQTLGYISYDATTYSWVTFLNELTVGYKLRGRLRFRREIFECAAVIRTPRRTMPRPSAT